jgi:predicted RNA-binding Zn ribbon-like protein
VPAYQQTIDSAVLPVLLGGHPALDFANTFAGWNGEPQHDYLSSYEHLLSFSVVAGLVPADSAEALRDRAASDPAGAEATLERARSLRRHLYPVLCGDGDAEDVDAVAAGVSAAACRLGLRRRRHDGRLVLELGGDLELTRPLHAVAWTSGQLLVSEDAAFVRACPGSGCGWLFLDRRGRRRWCTMAVCGNRAKARRYATRQHSSP